MASVNEMIVREYFEGLSFLVRQPRKYQVPARSRRKLREEVDLLAVNPSASKAPMPEMGIWTSADLKDVPRAIVGIRGWHTDRFSPAVLKQSPEVYRFAGSDVVSRIQSELGEGPVARILCLSELPASKSLQRRALAALKENGIDGVLLYATMLRELIDGIEIKKNYEKSDLLQLLRILKNYDLVKDSQLEFFKPRRRPRKKASGG